MFIGRITSGNRANNIPRQTDSTLKNEIFGSFGIGFQKGLMARALGVNNKECSLSLFDLFAISFDFALITK